MKTIGLNIPKKKYSKVKIDKTTFYVWTDILNSGKWSEENSEFQRNCLAEVIIKDNKIIKNRILLEELFDSALLKE